MPVPWSACVIEDSHIQRERVSFNSFQWRVFAPEEKVFGFVKCVFKLMDGWDREAQSDDAAGAPRGRRSGRTAVRQAAEGSKPY